MTDRLISDDHWRLDEQRLRYESHAANAYAQANTPGLPIALRLANLTAGARWRLRAIEMREMLRVMA